ncbi:MAG: helix-turn-helix domain-containing protein [Chitinivibrionales bacterium]|nr:helix-turn-helix domain-containing protein [Chitinivibrionales bacterium]
MGAATNTRDMAGAHRHHVRFDPAFPLLLSSVKLSIGSSQTPNYHDYLEVTLIEKGQGTFHAGRRSYAVSPGDVVLITAEEFHCLEAARGSSMNVSCVFFLPRIVHQPGGISLDYEYLVPFVKRGRGFENRIPHSHDTARAVYALTHRMRAETEAGRADQRLAVKTCLVDMLFALCRYYRDRMVPSDDDGKRRRELAALGPVFEHIEAHSAERLTGRSLAEVAGLSPAYLSRLFHRVTGTTLTGYITRYRVDRAKQLLLEDRLTTSQIAFEVGFESESYFYRAFRGITGFTPRTFRQRWASADRV